MAPIASLFAPRDVLMYGVLAALVVGAVFAVHPKGRQHRRFLIVATSTLTGWLAWNFTLNATNARGFNVDAPVIYLPTLALNLGSRSYLHGDRILAVDNFPASFAWFDKDEMKRQGIRR